MAQRSSHVPKFGGWDNDNIPYTVFFENARKERGGIGRPINPNDPEENPEAFMMYGRESHDQEDDAAGFSIARTPTHPSIAHYKKAPPPEERHANGRSELSGGDKNSMGIKKGYGRKKGYLDSDRLGSLSPSHASSRHSRQRSGSYAGDENRSISVPKFGAWDERDPMSSDGFTVLFNRVKAEKQATSATFRPLPPQAKDVINTNRNQPRLASKSKFLCCFSGGKSQ